MVDMLFLKLQNGRIIKSEHDNALYWFVKQQKRKYKGLINFRNFYYRIGFLEPDLHVRDVILARLFLMPECVQVFGWVESLPDERFASLVRNLKDHLNYSLFPMAPEFDRCAESQFGLGFGGALVRAVWLMYKWDSPQIGVKRILQDFWVMFDQIFCDNICFVSLDSDISG